MKRTLLLALALVSVSVASPRARADGPTPAPVVASPQKLKTKIAFIDWDRCVTETEDGLRARALLKKYSDKRQVLMAQMEERLKRGQEDLQKLAAEKGPPAKLSAAMANLQKEAQVVNDQMKRLNGEVAMREDELLGPIEKKLKAILQRIAEAEGYDLVVEKKAMPAGKPALDLTDKVVQEYNWGPAKK